MSYCRFENTYRDLLDCYHNMNNIQSEREHTYLVRMIDVCKGMIQEYELNRMSETEWDEDEDEDNIQDNGNDEYNGVSWDLGTK